MIMDTYIGIPNDILYPLKKRDTYYSYACNCASMSGMQLDHLNCSSFLAAGNNCPHFDFPENGRDVVFHLQFECHQQWCGWILIRPVSIGTPWHKSRISSTLGQRVAVRLWAALAHVVSSLLRKAEKKLGLVVLGAKTSDHRNRSK